MPKSRSKISSLPSVVRTAINLKIQEGWRLTTIADWLMAETAPVDIPDLQLKAGEPYALLWSRESDQAISPHRLCERALSHWHQNSYPRWEREQAEREEFLGLVERAERLGAAVGGTETTDPNEGTNRLIRSVLFEAITKVRKNENNTTDLARIAHAWARMNTVTRENENLKLRQQQAIDIGLRALLAEAKGKPKAIAAFYTFHDVVKGKEGERESSSSA
jgi:hypothetical protein